MTSGKQDILLIQKILRNVPVFKGLTDEYLRRIAEDVRITRFEKDDTVFHQSDESRDLYIVLSGRVRASLINEEGDELILTVFNVGDFFGEISLLDGVARSATIITEEQSTLGMLTRESFLSIARNNPMFLIDVLAIVAKRLRETDTMVGSLVFFDVTERLVKFLIKLARAEGVRDKDGFYRLRHRIHRDLAARIGASRVAITKSLKILAFKKIVKEKKGYFIIYPPSDKNIKIS
ncbi:MAG: Crp/Fnr family transcriptional regulator [Dissulfurispiraceae bacterium]|jgi:CRP-like cAMP-binding protein